MPIPPQIEENLRFILLEVRRQMERCQEVLDSPTEEMIEQIIGRDDYIDSLKAYIENGCFALIYHRENITQKRDADLIRAINTTAGNLERIADHAVNICRQIPYLKDPAYIGNFDYRRYFKIIHRALERVGKALFTQDLDAAQKICEAEVKLDLAYKKSFEKILAALTKGKDVENLITSGFILRYLERIGDCLLNIGEAIIFAGVGERLKLSEFKFLKEGLDEKHGTRLDQIEFHGVWGTRSGCRIGIIEPKSGGGLRKEVVFKEGKRDKISREKEKLELWHSIRPGLTPSILDYRERDDEAALMTEFLSGQTFQQVLKDKNQKGLDEGLQTLSEALSQIWEETKESCQSKPKFMGQLKSRLGDVFRVHPHFDQEERSVGELALGSTNEQVEHLVRFEKKIKVPFLVLIHGDFNLDNIFVKTQADRLQIIDVHRSGPGDYVQDISVFLVSAYRQRIFDQKTREQIFSLCVEFLRFARAFAKSQGDPHFEARLALGLIRSLITSTRFEFHLPLANAMYYRACYLIEKLLSCEEAPESFVLPTDIFNY